MVFRSGQQRYMLLYNPPTHRHAHVRTQTQAATNRRDISLYAESMLEHLVSEHLSELMNNAWNTLCSQSFHSTEPPEAEIITLAENIAAGIYLTCTTMALDCT